MHDYDPRLVDLYDRDNPDGPDHDFYRALADEIDAASILDLGCGTGILTVTFCQPGRTVVGVDPSANMLGYARRRTGADPVNWVLGESRAIPPGPFDYAVMTGNVAQHIGEPEWVRTLRDLRTALRADGVLAFESRNPTARAWEEWGSDERTVRETMHGELIEWAEVKETASQTITLRAHNLFAETGETVTEEVVLAFRELDTIRDQLGSARFVLEEVYGDWQRRPFTQDAPVMVLVARAR